MYTLRPWQIVTAVCLALLGLSVLAGGDEMESRYQQQTDKYKVVRGFNYQPSYDATGYAIWSRLQPEIIEREIAAGKRLFPGINTLRIWLSFDAFSVNPDQFARNFETMLTILDRHGLKAIPVLFNDWHSVPDFGGLAAEQIRYWYIDNGGHGTTEHVFKPYLQRIVGGHAKDARILVWDLCNEPGNSGNTELLTDFLKYVHDTCKSLEPKQPLGVSTMADLRSLQIWEPISDVLLIHPYFASNVDWNSIVGFAKQKGKALLATECCWGSLDDAERARIVENDLRILAANQVGFTPHLLHETLVADGHHPNSGVMSAAGYMAFINLDGSLRAGHDVYNRF